MTRPEQPAPQTLFQALWQSPLVEQAADGQALFYGNRHLIYEVLSAQAFEGLRMAGRQPWRRETVLATGDHKVPTRPAERVGMNAIARFCRRD